jgi:hypothetical protein
MKNNKNKISVLLSRGFEPKNNAKARIKMALQQKAAAPLHLKLALVLGSILLLIGLGVYTRNTEARYLGPNAAYSIVNNDYLTGQNFGESGPRGLETNHNYIHFR